MSFDRLRTNGKEMLPFLVSLFPFVVSLFRSW